MGPSAPYVARVLGLRALRDRSTSRDRPGSRELAGPDRRQRFFRVPHLAYRIHERLKVRRRVPSFFDGDPMALGRGDAIRGGCGGLTQEPAKKVDAVLVSFEPY